jgi:hypothetical protein
VDKSWNADRISLLLYIHCRSVGRQGRSDDTRGSNQGYDNQR